MSLNLRLIFSYMRGGLLEGFSGKNANRIVFEKANVWPKFGKVLVTDIGGCGGFCAEPFWAAAWALHKIHKAPVATIYWHLRSWNLPLKSLNSNLYIYLYIYIHTYFWPKPFGTETKFWNVGATIGATSFPHVRSVPFGTFLVKGWCDILDSTKRDPCCGWWG